jgi:glycosyltransferase involved in cell wall biosynthesis
VSSGLRVLVVSPYLPSHGAGGPVRLRGLVNGLPAPHRVSVVAFAPRPVAPADIDREVRARCEEVVVVPNERRAITGARKRALQLRSLLSPHSFERHVHERSAFQDAIDRICARTAFDLVQVEHFFMGYHRFPASAAVVLDEHNVEYAIRARTLAVVRPGPRKAYDHLNHRKLRSEEQRAWRDADGCAVTSPNDEATIHEVVPDLPTAVVPNAVDTSYFSASGAARERDTVLFVGSLGYYPNRDGLLFFLREVMPILRRSHSGVCVRIVGAAPPADLRRWEAPDVVFTGFVPDLRPLLERSGVVVAPLRIGGGTRLKILEALATAAPVVSTTLGAEGLSVTHGRDILLADTAESFAASVDAVLRDPELGAALGSAGRRLVEASYDWEASAGALEALYIGALRRARHGTTRASRAYAS